MTENEIIEKLSAVYGFRIPRDFAKVIFHVYSNAREDDGYINESTFVDYLTFIFDMEGSIATALIDDLDWETSLDTRLIYHNFPIELFPIGGPGVDGISYGFIVHAPETEAKDYPIGEFCPADDIGVFRLGANIRAAFEFMIARSLKNLSLKEINRFYENKLSEDDKNFWKSYRKRARQKANELAKLLKINPADCKIGKDYWKRKVKPKIPAGWRYETTWDGIGVLAPREKFSPDFDHSTIPDFDDINEELNYIRGFLSQGFPASALFVIRENFWAQSYKTGYFAQLAPLWAEIYEALNRTLLAKRVYAAAKGRQ